MKAFGIWSASRPARSACSWRSSTSSVSPASRAPSLSPTQRIGSNPAMRATGILRASASSVSLKYWRRSEWPRTTASTSSSTSIGAEISPVNAPDSPSCMFWAATRTAVPRRRSTTSCSAVNGGQITTSLWVAAIRGNSASMNSAASATVLCIFQLAAMYGVRSGIRGLLVGVEQGLDARQLLSLQQLQRGAAAGRDPIDPVLEAEPVQRGDAVAAADHGGPRRRRDRLGDDAGAGGEGLHLESPHRPVPEHGAGVGDRVRVSLRRPWADVEAHPAF